MKNLRTLWSILNIPNHYSFIFSFIKRNLNSPDEHDTDNLKNEYLKLKEENEKLKKRIDELNKELEHLKNAD